MKTKSTVAAASILFCLLMAGSAGAGPTNIVNSLSEASLQAAIAQGGWVGLPNGTITLTNTIGITNNVILDGSEVTATINGGNVVQLFTVENGASLTLSNLTLANGSGAIVCNSGAVAVIGCLLTNNNQPNAGGAIYNNDGNLTLLNTTFANNGVSGNACSGGAIYQATGSMAVSNCIFLHNSATNNGNGASATAGGALSLNAGSIIIDRSQFIANTASGVGASLNSGCAAYGGAVSSAASLTVNDSCFTGNQAVADNKVVLRSPGPGFGAGGAIYNTGTATLNRCLISYNSVQGGDCYPYGEGTPVGGLANGGGIYNASQLTATNCTIALNSATAGATIPANGVASGTTGNAMGGGIFNLASAAFTALNLTIASNACSAPAVGPLGSFSSLPGTAAGDQIANSSGACSVQNCLIAYPGTNYVGYARGASTAFTTNSNVYGTITDGGHNICSDGSAAFGGSSLNNTDPQLMSLGNYGGPTLSMALLATSPAIDAANPADFPPTDQRGYWRPIGNGPDVGAYEYASQPFGASGYLNLNPAGANSLLLTFSAYPPNSYRLQYSTNLLTWSDVRTNGPFVSPAIVSQSLNQTGNHGFYRVVAP